MCVRWCARLSFLEVCVTRHFGCGHAKTLVSGSAGTAATTTWTAEHDFVCFFIAGFDLVTYVQPFVSQINSVGGATARGRHDRMWDIRAGRCLVTNMQPFVFKQCKSRVVAFLVLLRFPVRVSWGSFTKIGSSFIESIIVLNIPSSRSSSCQ